jgi:Protein of unknown function (DUF2950)
MVAAASTVVAASTAAAGFMVAAATTSRSTLNLETTTMTRIHSSVGCAALAILTASIAAAQGPMQRTFLSAQDAAQALVVAVQNDDRRALKDVLGDAGLISTGDDSQDETDRRMFVDKYQEMHRLTREPDGTTVLYVGAENWPFPVPLLDKDGHWSFDADVGRLEVVMRRIGENEMKAAQVCQELVEAEKEYVATTGHYARRLVSDSGKHNGLYWKEDHESLRSPIGPFLAQAGAPHDPTPFHGYYYRVVSAKGGAVAFVAYPAEYRSSGVMTFIVGPEGTVYQRDLGPHTTQIAATIQSYEPGRTWRKVQ